MIHTAGDSNNVWSPDLLPPVAGDELCERYARSRHAIQDSKSDFDPAWLSFTPLTMISSLPSLRLLYADQAQNRQ